uniref:Serpentine receptor class gamma n=1 Tax=Steinernema glaseri TaxID=37863 RepID=A0A1I7Z537_9BILA
MACMTCALLAFNRCVDVWRPKWMMFLFSDHRTFFWLLLPFGYFWYFFFFTTPVLYTSKLYAWFFDPYFGTDDVPIERFQVRCPFPVGFLSAFQYMNFPHSINNIAIVIALLTLYVFLSVSIWYKAKIAQSEALSVMQRQIVIQSCTICAFDFIAAIIYVYMQFFETSVVFVVFGGAAIVYLSMNKTIRQGVLKMIIPKGDASRVYASQTAPTFTHQHSTH